MPDSCKPQKVVACFVSPHGFGHASRTSAILEALHEQEENLRIELFTQVPPWFFSRVPGQIGYHELDCDLGLIQTDALHPDLNATVAELGRRLPLDSRQIKNLGDTLRTLGCCAVICDIAPLGLAAAAAAKIPSVLVENFTWDWIYSGLAESTPALTPFSELVAPLFNSADLHIQTEPVCDPVTHAHRTGPVSRRPHQDAITTRCQLGLNPDRPLVFVSMGGNPLDFPFAGRLRFEFTPFDFVVAGIGNRINTQENVTFLPAKSSFYHPDLVHAADVVVGKVGYSTTAEVYEAGVPFGYVTREGYPEMEPLVRFLQQEVPGVPLGTNAYLDGSWLNQLPLLLSLKRRSRSGLRGATQCATLIRDLL